MDVLLKGLLEFFSQHSTALGGMLSAMTIAGVSLQVLRSYVPYFAKLLPAKKGLAVANISGHWLADFTHGSSDEKQVVELWRIVQRRGGVLRISMEHYSNKEPTTQERYLGRGIIRGNKIACYWVPDRPINPEVGSLALRLKNPHIEGDYLTWKESGDEGDTGLVSSKVRYEYKLFPVSFSKVGQLTNVFRDFVFLDFQEAVSFARSDEKLTEGNAEAS